MIMEELVSSSNAKSQSSFKEELLILHTAEAQEWAVYLRRILKTSRKLPRKSIVLYAVDLDDQTRGYNFEHFHSSTCIVLLLTAALLNFLEDQEILGALQRLLYPPQKVVVLLCGVTEDDIPIESFEHWHWWRKLYAEDEPAIYLSTILESIADSRTEEAENESIITNDIEMKKTLTLENPLVAGDCNTQPTGANVEISACMEGEIPVNADLEVLAATEHTEISPDTVEFEMPGTEEVGVQQSTEEVENSPVISMSLPEWEGIEQGPSDKYKESEHEDTSRMIPQHSPSQTSSPNHPICLTVQPNRILCGAQATIYLIFKNKINNLSLIEVGFSSSNVATETVSCAVENEYTISVAAPDMPPGSVSLTLLSDHLSVSVMPVTYYTNMEEVSSYFEQASCPMDFICQAFNITASKTETLDNFLTDSFKSKMPDCGLELFGVGQIEEVNMSACKRNSEFPTLLHFAAKHGLKRLATVLFGCPGASQAYSVMNKHGDYPNSLAEESGFPDLKHFMDEMVLNADVLELTMKDSLSVEEDGDLYEPMSKSTQDFRSCSPDTGSKEDIYESMLQLNPECMEDLYEAMDAVGDNTNPEEIILRKFFQANPKPGFSHHDEHQLHAQGNYDEEEGEHERFEEEDPYNFHPEDIYDTLDTEASYAPDIFNRPPAPIPRSSSSAAKPEEPTTYISRVFSAKADMMQQLESKERSFKESSVPDVPSVSDYGAYAGIKTPGQRQLIALQEKVKVGDLSVDEAVQEFKSWQANQGQRSISIRYQQENLKRLRASITRRHKEKEKMGKELELEISSPLPNTILWGANMTVECSVYEPAPRVGVPPPPVARPVQRGTWQTGSSSSTSSTESNRLSTHSTFSCSSGTEPDFEDTIDCIPPPPRPPRPADGAPSLPPPRVLPRIPQESDSPTRAPEKLHQERYISCPSRAAPQRPTHRATQPPRIPRRMR